MPRVKRGKSHLKKRKSLLSKTKGFRHGKKKLIKQAKTVVLKAGKSAFKDRRAKKRTARALWQIKLNAAAREHGLSYSQFIKKLKDKKVELDRKVLADLAENHPKIFEKIIKEIS
ncbi:MAG TPA: 50S ribosomal protein L20 [Candidatus Bipolaricaulota bacterium]|nr:50S ribosomal protein L20 [Candidatus Bipolaricaulota bacterium]